MKRQNTGILLSLMLLVSSSGIAATPVASAKKIAKKATPAPEVYPATEEGGSYALPDEADGSETVTGTIVTAPAEQEPIAPLPPQVSAGVTAAPSMTANVTVENPAPAQSRPQQSSRAAAPATQTTVPAPATPAPPSQEVAFDTVPASQVEPIARRLKLVETIIRKHGRAYDYRVHTVKDLELILAQLDRASQIAFQPRPGQAR